VAIRRVQWWVMLLVALLNSGGLGYWVCHGQVRSGSFWLCACSEDVSFALRAKAAPKRSDAIAWDKRSCDCQFVTLTVPLPTRSSRDAPLHWGEPILLHEQYSLSPVRSVYLRIPRAKAPPLSSAFCAHPRLRAPPTA
jgi:hypothetical protein